MLFIIFGWGKTKRKLEGAYRQSCENCHNDATFALVRQTKWFDIFWVPIFPYEFKYLLLCTICTAGRELKRDAYEALLPDGKKNLELLTGEQAALLASQTGGTRLGFP